MFYWYISLYFVKHIKKRNLLQNYYNTSVSSIILWAYLFEMIQCISYVLICFDTYWAAVLSSFPKIVPVLPCLFHQFLTMPNVWSLNKYCYLFIKNIDIKDISNQKIIKNIFISVLIDIISHQTCHFFFIFDL